MMDDCQPGLEDQVKIAQQYFDNYSPVWGSGFSWASVSSNRLERQEFGNLTLIKSEFLDYRVHHLAQPAVPGKLQMPRVATEVCIDSNIGPLSIINTHLAFQDSNEAGLSYHYAVEASQRANNWQRLTELKQDVLNQFSSAHPTADQPFRLTDIAFDINQDHKIEISDAFEIAKFCEVAGMNVKISSIHINVWFGKYNKASTAQAWLKHHQMQRCEAMFIGDSPNDDSMFSHFDHTVGVANIKPFIDELNSPPSYITQKFGGYGFAEMAESLIAG